MTNRWPLIVALLTDPVRESRRLIAALGRWQAPTKRHSIMADRASPKVEPSPAPAPTPADQAEPQPKKERKPLPRGEARFSAKRWAAERAARLAGKDRV